MKNIPYVQDREGVRHGRSKIDDLVTRILPGVRLPPEGRADVGRRRDSLPVSVSVG